MAKNEDSVLHTLWEQSGRGPFLFPNDETPCALWDIICGDVGRGWNDRSVQDPVLSPMVGMSSISITMLALIVQHQCETSLHQLHAAYMFLGLMERLP